MDDRLRYMGFQMPYKLNFCIRSQQDSLLHLFCQGETASQVWSYLKGVLNASFVQDSMSAYEMLTLTKRTRASCQKQKRAVTLSESIKLDWKRGGTHNLICPV